MHTCWGEPARSKISRWINALLITPWDYSLHSTTKQESRNLCLTGNIWKWDANTSAKHCCNYQACLTYRVIDTRAKFGFGAVKLLPTSTMTGKLYRARPGKCVSGGISALVQWQYGNISCTKAFTTHAARVKAGTCGALPPSIVLWRSDVACHSAVWSLACLSLHIVQLGAPACVTVPETEQILVHRIASVELSQEGRKLRPPALLPPHAATQTRGRWGWASLHYPVASFSIQLKVHGDPDTTAFRRNDFWCLRSLFFLFCFSFIYSSLYFLYAHRLPVHLTALCWSHPPALPPSSPQFSSCGSLFPRLGNINMATQQKYAPVLYKHGNRCTIICSQMMQARWLHLVVVSTDKEGS